MTLLFTPNIRVHILIMQYTSYIISHQQNIYKSLFSLIIYVHDFVIK